MTPWKHLSRLAILTLILILLSSTAAFGQDDQEYNRVYILAREAAQAKQYNKAYELFAQAANLAQQAGDQDVVQSSKRILSQLELAFSQQALDQENYERALEQANKGIEHNPDHAGNYYNKGLALKNLDRIDEAMDALAKAIEVAGAASNRHIVTLAERAIRDLEGTVEHPR